MNLYKLLSFWLCSQLFCYQFLNLNLVFELGITISPDRIIFGLVIMSFLIQLRQYKTESLGISKIEYCMILFAIICTVSFLIHGADSSLEKNRFLTTLFNLIYFPFTTYFIARNIQYSREGVKIILKTLLLIGIYLAFTAVFERYKLNDLVWPKYILDPSVGDHFGRSRGPFVNSGVMGRYLTVTFISTTMILLYVKGAKKMLLISAMMLMIAGLYFASTRSPMLAFAAILVFMCFFSTGKIKKTLLCIGIILLMMAFLGLGNKISFFEDNLFTKRQSTIEYRYANYNVDIEMIKENFLFGIGYGKFESEWRKYYSEGQYESFNLDHGNHNTFLGLFAETGIIGISLYIAIFFLILKLCLKTHFLLEKTLIFEKSLVVLGLSLMVLYFTVGQFADLRFHQLLQNTMFLFFGIVVNINRNAKILNERAVR